MSDFLKFLYASYITPQLEAALEDEDSCCRDEMYDKMSYQCEQLYWKVHEFTAVHAFLLGLRTGRGLPQ